MKKRQLKKQQEKITNKILDDFFNRINAGKEPLKILMVTKEEEKMLDKEKIKRTYNMFGYYDVVFEVADEL